jgi:hypothetical protein
MTNDKRSLENIFLFLAAQSKNKNFEVTQSGKFATHSRDLWCAVGNFTLYRTGVNH